MKALKNLLAVTALVGLTSSASAIMSFEQQISGNPLDTLSANGDSQYTNSWTNITSGGNLLQTWLAANPTYEIVSAVVKFGFADDSDYSYEYAKAWVQGKFVDLGGDQNGDLATEVDGSHQSGWDYHSGDVDSADFGGLEDGVVEFKVKANQGDFYLKTAKITVNVDKKSTPPPPPTTRVPDAGSSIALLGLGLIGLAAIRRRFVK